MRFRFFLLFLFPLWVHAMPGYFEPWGRDADLSAQTAPEPEKKFSLSVRVAEKVIRFRQQVLARTDGPRSHFQPTSSQYMLLSMQKYGFFEGYIRGCDRLMRENSDDWVYPKIKRDGKFVKYDPVK